MIRKRKVALTPEEWVRQHVLHFLVHDRRFPSGLIEVEKSIRVFNTDKRVDILVRSATMQPYLLVECKAADVALSQKEAEQLARYQITVNAPYSLLTNGRQHIVMHNTEAGIAYLPELPVFTLSAS